jgi:hypothetical protein
MKRTLGVILLLLLVLIAAVFASAPLLASYDARRVAQHKTPIFCWSHWIGGDWEMLDGGSTIYRGFGYELTAKHKIVSAYPKRYDSGVAVTFTFPFYSSIAWLDGTRCSTVDMAKLFLCFCDKCGTWSD